MAASQELPKWMIGARETYYGPERHSVQTNFSRGEEDIDILRKKVLPSRKHDDIQLLVVGVGLDAFPFQCSYLPFKLAAFLEGQGVDYHMDLLDRDEKALGDVESRQDLYLAPDKALPEDRADFHASWATYVREVGARERVVYDIHPEIPFHPFVGKPTQESVLQSGVHVAPIPSGFKAKRASNDGVRFFRGDIAAASLPIERYDYISCTYVLYLLPPEGQQLALLSMARSLAPGGMLLTNEIGGGSHFFTKARGGWLGDRELSELQLRHEPNDTRSSYVQLAYRKI
jgi:hypothetical protein